jgi:hypothetical protein
MKFKQMTIVCNDVAKLKEIYVDKFVNAAYVIDITDEDNIYEIAKDKLEIMQINDTVILSVNEFCSVKDMIGGLKAHKLNAVVLENLATTYDKKYIGFKTLDELIDFVINGNKKFKFISKTAKYLSDNYVENPNKLYEVSGDTNILSKELQEMFVF